MYLRYLACVFLTLCSAAFVAVGQEDERFAEPTGRLSLNDAIRFALLNSPGLEAFEWDVRAADARILQASLRPNPELGVEIEDIRLSPGPTSTTNIRGLGGSLDAMTGFTPAVSWGRERESGPRSGFSEAEITIAISQLIELGGKRAKRIAAAERGREVILWDYESARANVIYDAATAFYEVLAAQENVTLQHELTRLAEDVLRSTELRVRAGQVSPLEENRAEAALSLVRIGLERARRELSAARYTLAAAWGGTEPVFTEAVGQFDSVASIPTLESLRGEVYGNPDISRWASEIALREANLQSERAQRIVDPTLELGFRSTGLGRSRSRGFSAGSDGAFGWSGSDSDFDSDRDNRFVVGFSIPLPFFDRNQGNIAEAEHMISKASSERREVEVVVTTQLASNRAMTLAAYDEIMVLKEEVLPLTGETLSKTQIGYEQGKFSYLDVLDAQRTLFEARTNYLDALRRYHIGAASIQRLTGKALQEWEDSRITHFTEDINGLREPASEEVTQEKE